ncbi:NUDIX domain-containing protein [Streptomyces sp. CB02959]|uniref:NUDIX domain-containing protein n=1 Tax=unclassified Streptomyces TaxID=2593676 RepID=UPI000C273D70|nr:NUDIX domain-containing protein [Streptomyces sp. CB02959]PJN38546.1 NUDIX hydrolase [Streptomyces sp. CB02959]
MPPLRLRHAVRALVLDEAERILLCRHLVQETGTAVWAAPGGGIERHEGPLAALRRELREEVGLVVAHDPPHVWHQEVVGPGYAVGYDGVVNDYFLVRTAWFAPSGALTAAELAAEHIDGLKWWRPAEIAACRGPDLFSPRDLATPLRALLRSGVPREPLVLGV